MSSVAAIQLLELAAMATTPRFGAVVPLMAANGAPTSGPLLQDVDGYRRARDEIMTAVQGQHEVRANDWFLQARPDGFSGTHVMPSGTHVTEMRADLSENRTRVSESVIRRGQLVEVSQELSPRGALVRNSVTSLFVPLPFRGPSLPGGLQNHRGLFQVVEVLESIANDFRSVDFIGPLKIRIDFFTAGKRTTQTVKIPLDELFLQYAIEFFDEGTGLQDVAYLIFSPGVHGVSIFSDHPMKMPTVKIRVPSHYDFVKVTGLQKKPYEGIVRTHFDIFFAFGGAEYASEEPVFQFRSPHRVLVQGGDIFGVQERIVAEPGSWHLPTVFAIYGLVLERLRGRP